MSVVVPNAPAQEQIDYGSIARCPSGVCATLPASKLPWARIAVGIFVAAQTMFLGMTINLTAPDDPVTLLLLQTGMLAATLVVLALLGLPLAMAAARELRQMRVTMELLFLVGIGASLGISLWSMWRREGPVYFEVVNVLLVVYSVGHAITMRSRDRAIAATREMLDEVASARREDGSLVEVTAIGIGDLVRVVPGELIPVDGVVMEGRSFVRTTAFSGEWQSRVRQSGDAVLAGTACEDGTLLVRASSTGVDRRIDHVAALIASACQSSSPMQRLADRFVRFFLPVVAVFAAAALLWPGLRGDWTAGLFNALAVVLVACPCAAGLATPLATWTAIVRLAEKGLLLKSAESLQRLASSDSVIFDKTGTLADERLELKDLSTAPEPRQRQRTLALLAEVERHSGHPVARALRELPQPDSPRPAVVSVNTLPGRGIEAIVQFDGRPSKVSLVRRENADDLTIDATMDRLWIATAVFTERLRESSASAIGRLREMGMPVEIMTGDSSASAADAGRVVATPVTGGMTPQQKHDATIASRRNVLFVGDGVNDAAAMGASHCSIAMSSGAQIALAAADATLSGSDLSVIPEAVELSRRAMGTMRSNFAWAVAYNAVGMTLAAGGWLHPVVAAILMSVSSGVVAWRSFNLVGKPTAPRVERAARTARNEVAPPDALPYPLYATLHAAGIIGQGAILIPLAMLDLSWGLVAMGISVAVAFAVIRLGRRLPGWLDMTLAMVSIGGLGMNLGWWMDLHFDPAIRNGTVMACCMAGKTLEAATLQSQSHWMYWLMLLSGVPAMYLLRRGPLCFNWRDWCCGGMLILGVPAMCFGMWAGAQLASAPVFADFSAQVQVVIAYLLMMAGMCAGMLATHALGLAIPVRGR